MKTTFWLNVIFGIFLFITTVNLVMFLISGMTHVTADPQGFAYVIRFIINAVLFILTLRGLYETNILKR